MSVEAGAVHVTWGVSRADSVREALRLQGRGDRVIGLAGAFSMGPLDPPDRHARGRWFATHTRPDGEPGKDDTDPEASWTAATAPSLWPVYWVCLADAGEHATFLEFVSRMAGRPFDVVDATGIAVTTAAGIAPVWSLGTMRPEAIVASSLGNGRRIFRRAESDAAVAAWARLRRENAPLRVVRDGRLVSAPLTAYDAVVLAQAASDREPVVKLIGRVLHHLCVGADPPGQGCSDEFLFARVFALAATGALDVTGPGPGMRDYAVRQPVDAPTRRT